MEDPDYYKRKAERLEQENKELQDEIIALRQELDIALYSVEAGTGGN